MTMVAHIVEEGRRAREGCACAFPHVVEEWRGGGRSVVYSGVKSLKAMSSAL
jgi:hypothetical protein